MRKLTTLLLTVTLVLLSGCAVFNTDMQDIKVDAVTDPKANMAGYSTYVWLGAVGGLNDPTEKWQPPSMDITGDIKYLIDRELRKHGINSATENSDLAVAFFIGVDMEAMQLKDDPDTQGDVLENVPQGALVVALIDTKTGYVVWRGLAKADIVVGASSEQIRNRLDYAISKMFKELK